MCKRGNLLAGGDHRSHVLLPPCDGAGTVMMMMTMRELGDGEEVRSDKVKNG